MPSGTTKNSPTNNFPNPLSKLEIEKFDRIFPEKMAKILIDRNYREKNIREWKSWQLQESVHARTWRGRMEKFRYTLGDSMQNWKLTVETARARRKVFAESFPKNRIGSTARVQNVGYGNFIGSVRHLNRMSRISKGAGRWNKE